MYAQLPFIRPSTTAMRKELLEALGKLTLKSITSYFRKHFKIGSFFRKHYPSDMLLCTFVIYTYIYDYSLDPALRFVRNKESDSYYRYFRCPMLSFDANTPLIYHTLVVYMIIFIIR